MANAILGIETSCDETAASVVERGTLVCSNVIASQVDKHAAYGGVIPELAAREHARAIDGIVEAALAEAETSPESLAGVAVVNRPGLVPALLVGVSYAKGLAAALNVPLLPVNHIIAHVYAAFLGESERLSEMSTYPLVALVVSGGHTLLLRIDGDGRLSILGQTLDDAAGEA
ncbi:MAG: tRNA (adenosine(37)-N6)-threonylcarbamoyltransferase complex transferase subunit TsaD, partial [bacterium]